MSTDTERRNQRITAYLNKFYEMAKERKGEGSGSTDLMVETKEGQLLIEIFGSKTISYREIILVSLVAKYLDKDFSAYSNFYGCKPRGIFEGPIKEFLLVHGFPHTKSGPLNIAKASNINEDWSSQREPKEDADKVVRLVKVIDKGDAKTNDNLSLELMQLYMDKAKVIENLSVSLSDDSNPVHLYNLCKRMIDEAPDGGNTPQRIFGYLLKAQNDFPPTGIVITGTEDSASTTSTTSKKPGDINEELPSGEILKVYEVTVKPFNLSRIKDSYDCLSIYNRDQAAEIKEVIVVCRDRDCPENMNKIDLGFCMGSYEYQDTIYYFWNIYEWMAFILQHMTEEARKGFYSLFNNYVNDPNTHEPVKVKWNQLHNS